MFIDTGDTSKRSVLTNKANSKTLRAGHNDHRDAARTLREIEKGKTVNTTTQLPEIQALVNDAAEAQERFGDDELERFAEQMRRDLLPQCFAVPGESCIIDTINPETGRSNINGENLEQIRLRYPLAVVMSLDAWTTARAKLQSTLIQWVESTEDAFFEMLNVLPPAAWHNGAFLVGEASDHCYKTGRPRFQCYKGERDGKFATSSRPITHKEFVATFGPCPCFYS